MWNTDLVVLAHGHTRRVLPLSLLDWHPLAGVVRGGQRPGSVWCGVLPLLRLELAVWPVLLTPITPLHFKNGKNQRHLNIECNNNKSEIVPSI